MSLVWGDGRKRLFLSLATVIVGRHIVDPTSFLRIVQSALEQRGPAVERKVIAFLTLIQLLSYIKYFKKFESLTSEQQKAFLMSLFRSPLALIRKGFWGLKTLVFMGYYGHPSVYPTLHYPTQKHSP